MKKNGRDILTDNDFRRTPKCSEYSKRIASISVPSFPIEVLPTVTADYIWTTGFKQPVKVLDMSAIDIKVPSPQTSILEVAEAIGLTEPVKLIEVGSQSEILGYTIGDYAKYLSKRTSSHKLLNLISLEISATPMSSRVVAPAVARVVDWVERVWPIDRMARGDYPRVQKYCLCGMAGAYTDFHLDFGGTSVWYHVIWGKKIFYLIPPSCENLLAFQKWTCSSEQDQVFFGSLVAEGQCQQIEVLAGQTLFLPGGWIHAVFTPEDSLVFGGNFLHSGAILRQLQVHAIEARTHVAKQYRFPSFKLLHWLLLCSLLPLADKYLLGVKDQGESDSDSDDDDDEELVQLCRSFKSLVVFRQLPFLIKVCQLWTVFDEIQDGDIEACCAAAREAGCGSLAQVVERWWDIVSKIATSLDALDDSGTQQKHVQRIRTMAEFDILSDSMFVDCPDLVFPSVKKEVKVETARRDLVIDKGEKSPEVQQQAYAPLTLRLSAAAAQGEGGGAECGDIDLSSDENDGEDDGDIDENDDNYEDKNGKEGLEAEKDVSLDMQGAAETSKLKFKFSLTVQSATTAALTSDAIVSDSSQIQLKAEKKRVRQSHLVPAAPQPRPVPVALGDVELCENRTRGNRVSAEVLQVACDYEVDPTFDGVNFESWHAQDASIFKPEDEDESGDEAAPEVDSDEYLDSPAKRRKARKNNSKKTIVDQGRRELTVKAAQIVSAPKVVEPKPAAVPKKKTTVRQMLLKKLGGR